MWSNYTAFSYNYQGDISLVQFLLCTTFCKVFKEHLAVLSYFSFSIVCKSEL
jgi:hypothetical protein